MSETKNHHRVTEAGKSLGRNMVRLIEPGLRELAAAGVPDDRCASCAFREGTVPNGCIQTQGDVFKAVVENVTFGCHAPYGKTCHGWLAAQVALHDQRDDPKFQALREAAAKIEFTPPEEE